MKNLMILFFLALSFSSFGQSADPPEVDHCEVASEKAREAANDFGNGNFGDAAHNAGEAAGAAYECAKGALRDDD